MSDKFTKIVAVFSILFLAGILISAIFPDREEDASGSFADIGSVTPDVVMTQETTESDGSSADFSSQTMGMYYYNAISQEEKALYEQIYTSIVECKEVNLNNTDQNSVQKVFECVTNDHPEIFYCSSYKIQTTELYGEVMKITFMPNWHMTEETVEQCRTDIKRYVESCTNSIPRGADEYTKVKAVYEYIISNTDYVPNSQNNQNICSVCIGGQSVCMGYAKTTQYILLQLGIDTTLAFGTVGGESHSWNLVRVDGEYYYMDTTWGDAGYVRPGAAENTSVGRGINYEYFLITTDQITKTHEINNIVTLPACVATRNNYYIREGLYMRVYDEATLNVIFDRMSASADKSATIRCADAETYQETKDKLIFEQKIFDYLDAGASVSYSYNDDLYTLIFWIE